MYKNLFKDNYAKYLMSYDWDIWGTLTTEYFLSQSSAERAVKRLDLKLRKKFRNYRLFFVAEPFKQRGYHIHFIGKFISDKQDKTVTQIGKIIENEWQTTTSNKKRSVNKLKKYEHKQNAIFYILKEIYNTKVSYDFLGDAW
ncbi:MAG: hypothetical protein KGO81_01225 [Bacteroidota bacterium]|nr:hypothetical protein [Bacteroidota bacterium]